MVIIPGRDNNGKERQVYANKIAALDDNAFTEEAEQVIWLSAYAANNPRSDYHWQADVCFTESKDRGKPELYEKAYEKAKANA